MDLDILKYKNLFPSDISEAAAFLLKVMCLLPPLHENAARQILKPLICDDNAVKTLRDLERKQYIWKRTTALGNFYAITSKTDAALDVFHERTAHRRQAIYLKPLFTYILKTDIAAKALVRCGAIAYLRAWKSLPQEEKDRYLSEHGIDNGTFNFRIAKPGISTINLLPRSIVSLDSVLSEMAGGITNGKIPFTKPYNQKIYQAADSAFLKCGKVYDVGKDYVSKLSSKFTKSGIAHRTPQENAKLLEARKQTGDAKRGCEALTYAHGIKPLTLSTLGENGIFIIDLKDSLHLGILDNANYGLTPAVLNARLDYCVSFSEQLNKKLTITIFSLPEYISSTKKRLEKCGLFGGLSEQDILWNEVSRKRPPLKSETWNKFMEVI